MCRLMPDEDQEDRLSMENISMTPHSRLTMFRMKLPMNVRSNRIRAGGGASVGTSSRMSASFPRQKGEAPRTASGDGKISSRKGTNLFTMPDHEADILQM